MSDTTTVLVFNSGSSSLRFGVFGVVADVVATRWLGTFAFQGSRAPVLHVEDGEGVTVAASRYAPAASRTSAVPTPSARAIARGDEQEIVHDIARQTAAGHAAAGAQDEVAIAVERACALLHALGAPKPTVVGHRVVHGGQALRWHALIDVRTRRALDEACAFAPLHTPATLRVIDAARRAFPRVPHIACLDTSFHDRMPAEARTLPIGEHDGADGLRRYGFHGLACESILQRLGTPPPARAILAHLGGGASVTAVRDGRSVDTSMGLSPTGGVLMATRCGDVDPGALLYLARRHGWDLDDIERECNHASGMAAIGGHGGDMQALQRAAPRDARAALAIRMFCRSVAKAIAGMMSVLGGADTIVFSGGIGTHDAHVRAEVCEALGWAGVRLDNRLNETGATAIHLAGSRCRVLVLRANEEAQIARHAAAFALGR